MHICVLAFMCSLLRVQRAKPCNLSLWQYHLLFHHLDLQRVLDLDNNLVSISWKEWMLPHVIRGAVAFLLPDYSHEMTAVAIRDRRSRPSNNIPIFLRPGSPHDKPDIVDLSLRRI